MDSKYSAEEQKEEQLGQDSQNDSDKTKDTVFQVTTEPFFKLLQQFMSKLMQFLENSFAIVIKICDGTSASDKFVRLTSAIIKFVKNFQMISLLSKFDKFTGQVTQLRRLLRVNRILAIIKDYVGFIKKTNRKGRDFFDLFFKTVMLTCDIHDMLAYLMQLKVIRQRGLAVLKRNVANIYFLECVLWTCQHVFDYFTKDKTQQEIKNRRITIAKYLMDTIISHNDFSMKKFSVGIKETTLLGLSSSLIGIGLIWK